MTSGGKTRASAVAIGRKILCKENPTKPARSQCAKQLTKTVKQAQKGMTHTQKKKWLNKYYMPAQSLVAKHCDIISKKRCNPWAPPGTPWACSARSSRYKACTTMVLKGAMKFKDARGKKKYIWIKILLKGAKSIVGSVNASGR